MKLGYSAAKAANQWAEEKHLSSARLANLSRDKAFLLREPWKQGLKSNTLWYTNMAIFSMAHL
jgi:hypothetical protein